ncbi:putative Uncharacterized HTH-type transcriptional regulator YdhC [uncultured Desulfatiglans sp.]|uniref:Putative Uncharacterized HTH-type transcriptional regulator YdhC n=1 Tax=Uncultured Desulfatiglans sp. TaxID=1748965 RepID=A0A653A6F1_UNCDX|nr:putative Uncharacterized HTH-type transcriptional regulator YdhC [uncultured Desulfatiglans sp.]
MSQRPDKNSSLRTRAYEAIKDKIIYLNLKPGDKIFESEIAQELGVSRTPVREALLLLENELLVECDPRLGFQVKRLTPTEIEEYFAIRIVFEEFVAPFIIERITREEIEALKRNVEEADESVKGGDLTQIIRRETDFHTILYQAAKSEMFFHIISRIVDKFQWLRAIGLSAPGGAEISLGDHRAILEVVEARDTEALKRLMTEHIRHGKERFEQMKALFF